MNTEWLVFQDCCGGVCGVYQFGYCEKITAMAQEVRAGQLINKEFQCEFHIHKEALVLFNEKCGGACAMSGYRPCAGVLNYFFWKKHGWNITWDGICRYSTINSTRDVPQK